MKMACDARPVLVEAGEVTLEGVLALPEDATGLVLFAHGSGSGRHSPRNRFVAQQLLEAGVGYLLFDLLTPAEEEYDASTGMLRFDIPLLAERVLLGSEWVRAQKRTAGLTLGYFGGSTGAAAALVAAGRHPAGVGAVVSRGGRPDLARDWLPRVQAPTLLIVGGLDDVVIRLNEEAMARMRYEVRLEIVPGATHLFPEAGALERVAELAAEWFRRFL